jgi:hypothetical protein
MAEYGELNRKGATLSDVTAQKEFGVSRDFIVQGIQAGKLEYREGAVWGNPYLRVLRRQLEAYIAEKLGSKHLTSTKTQAELRKVKKEIAQLEKKLTELKARKSGLEQAVGKWRAWMVMSSKDEAEALELRKFRQFVDSQVPGGTTHMSDSDLANLRDLVDTRRKPEMSQGLIREIDVLLEGDDRG